MRTIRFLPLVLAASTLFAGNGDDGDVPSPKRFRLAGPEESKAALATDGSHGDVPPPKRFRLAGPEESKAALAADGSHGEAPSPAPAPAAPALGQPAAGGSGGADEAPLGTPALSSSASSSGSPLALLHAPAPPLPTLLVPIPGRSSWVPITDLLLPPPAAATLESKAPSRLIARPSTQVVLDATPSSLDGRLPEDGWRCVASYLEPLDTHALALVSRADHGLARMLRAESLAAWMKTPLPDRALRIKDVDESIIWSLPDHLNSEGRRQVVELRIKCDPEVGTDAIRNLARCRHLKKLYLNVPIEPGWRMDLSDVKDWPVAGREHGRDLEFLSIQDPVQDLPWMDVHLGALLTWFRPRELHLPDVPLEPEINGALRNSFLDAFLGMSGRLETLVMHLPVLESSDSTTVEAFAARLPMLRNLRRLLILGTCTFGCRDLMPGELEALGRGIHGLERLETLRINPSHGGMPFSAFLDPIYRRIPASIRALEDITVQQDPADLQCLVAELPKLVRLYPRLETIGLHPMDGLEPEWAEPLAMELVKIPHFKQFILTLGRVPEFGFPLRQERTVPCEERLRKIFHSAGKEILFHGH